MQSFGRILSEAQKDWAELRKGVNIIASKKLQEYQKEWEYGDSAKKLDLSRAPYWIQADGGELVPVDIKEVLGGEA